MAVMRRIGSRIVKDKKAEVEQLGESSSIVGRDLLSVLIRANMNEDAAERLDDETLLAGGHPQTRLLAALADRIPVEISTFLLAGHETTSAAVSWGLYALATDSNVQKKLREEVLTVPSDSPSMDELNALSYLNNVVKELLRLTVNQL